jgi:hypothetical protein
MKRLNLGSVLLLLSGFSFLIACGQQGTTIQQFPTQPTQPTQPTDPPPVNNAPNILTSNILIGSNGQPCTNVCMLGGQGGSPVFLSVKYTDFQGIPVSNGVVFTTDALPTQAQLSSTVADTDPTGVANMNMNILPGANGTVTVTVTGMNDPAAGQVQFLIQMDSVTPPVLEVTYTVATVTQVSTVRTMVYETINGQPDCLAVAGGVANTFIPAANAGPNLITQPTIIQTLPNLTGTTTRTYTIVGYAPDNTAPKLMGCHPNLEVRGDTTNKINITMTDLPMSYMGTYDAHTYMDLVTGIPGTAGDVINILTQLFTDPGTLLIEAACANASGTLGTVCSIAPSVLGGVANDILLPQMENLLGPGVVNTGQWLSEMLHDVRLESTLTFNSEPGPTGLFPPGTIHERWDSIILHWELLSGCDPNAPGCGVVHEGLDVVFGAKPESNVNGSVVGENKVHIDPHTVPGFDYADLMIYLVEDQILPKIFNGVIIPSTSAHPSQYWGQPVPPVSSFEDLMGILLGDQYCLFYDDCCEYFAVRLQAQIGSLAALAPAVCDAAISAAANWLEDQIDQLSGPVTIGTFDNNPCGAVDVDNDLKVNTLGKEGEHCLWDATFGMPGSEFKPNATWWAERR